MRDTKSVTEEQTSTAESGAEEALETAEATAEQQQTQPAAETLVLQHPPTPVPPKEPAKKSDTSREEQSQSPYSITVGTIYDGPMDLLLDLIRKQNIDIYDIPIAKITAQFLAYCEHLKQTDVDSAGEFVYTASLLIHIKSKMLLPREASLIANGDMEDPRRELVERLLEHERFKAAAQMLLQKQQIEEATWTNPGIAEFTEEITSEREIAADTTDLVRVFQEILERIKTRPILNVDAETVTVAQMLDYTKRRLALEDRPISLRKLLANTHSQQALICMFLALLEMVRLQAILLRQMNVGGDILIKKSEGFDDVIADHSTLVRDDWR